MMKNLTIGTKLFLGFGTVLIFLVVSTGLSLQTMATNNKHLEEMEVAQKLADNASNIRNNITRIIDATKSLILLDNAEQKKRVLSDIGEFRNAYKEHMAALLKNANTAEGKKLAETLQENIIAGKATSIKLIDLAMRDDRQGFVTVWQQEANPINERNLGFCKQVRDYFDKQAALSSDHALVSNRQAKIVMIMFSILAITLSLAVAGLFSKTITAPIHHCVHVAEQIAQGDLSVRIEAEGKDEMAHLMRAMQHMTGSLKDTMATLASASQGISSAATELRATSGMMADGADEVVAQASSVATAGEEMAATAEDIARNCHLAANSADKANTVAEAGFKVVENSVAVMGTIAARVTTASRSVGSLGGRSEQIGEIIGTIEDIADQTNLLALNAAIEAARAGDQGRGFAVVADEVRALAERTARATREIGVMIKTIQTETTNAVTVMEEGVREVEKGTTEAAKSGDALQAILEQIKDVTSQANQIATAAEEQTATTNDISCKMQGITDIVQRSAAGAAETASSASQLSRLALELQEIVGHYKVA